MIGAIGRANKAAGAKDSRPVMIHGQTTREDQIDLLKTEGIIPSFFVAHTFFWGDWHRDSVLGESRASRISPLKSAEARGMPFTIHNDSPVVPPDMMRLMWSAVNRTTRTGKTLGPEQRVSPLQALKAMTKMPRISTLKKTRRAQSKWASLLISRSFPTIPFASSHPRSRTSGFSKPSRRVSPYILGIESACGTCLLPQASTCVAVRLRRMPAPANDNYRGAPAEQLG